MVNFLTSVLNLLPEYQQQAIGSLLSRKKKSGEPLSIRNQQSEILRIYNEIKSKLGNILLTPRVAVPDQKISSADHNYNMESIHLDLNALYKGIDKVGKVFLLQSVSLDSGYQKARAAIEKLINDAKVFALRKKYEDFNEIKVIDFNSSGNVSNVLPKAYVNPKTRLLQLRPIGSSRVQLTNRNNKITKIYSKTISTGIKSSLSKSFPLENIVDQKPETFWATLVMSDYPISQTYATNNTGSSESQFDLNGPVVEVYFRFSHLERLNHIRLLPFADKPVRVVSISYRASPDSDVFVTIPDFTASTALDWEEYNFSSIFSIEIKVTLCQENPKLIVYQLPEGIVKNTDIFQKLYDSKLSSIIGNDIIDSDGVVESSRSNTIFEEATKSLSEAFALQADQLANKNKIDYYYNFNKVISDVLTKIDPSISQETIFGEYSEEELTSDKLIQLKKYEYIIGLRELEMGYAVYSPVGNFSTEKFEVQATVAEVQLEVDERHPVFATEWEKEYRKTSTEWAIDLGDGRVAPIHPRNLIDEDTGDPFAKDELITFDSALSQATTRLGSKYSSVAALKKDGQIIPETEYIARRLTGSIPVLRLTMTGSNWYDPNSIYTADYYVDPTSYKLEVLGKYKSRELTTPESFTGTSVNNDILLSKHPYIDYTVMNLRDYFSPSGEGNWAYIAPQEDQYTGQIRLWPTIVDSLGSIVQTGRHQFTSVSGVWGPIGSVFASSLQLSGNPKLDSQFFGEISGVPFGYYLKIMDSSSIYEISGFPVAYTGVLKELVVTSIDEIRNWYSLSSGYAFSGNITGAATGVSGALTINYSIGVGIKTEDQVFALSNNLYSPITVYVNDRLARNITDYYQFQHPAFSVSSQPGVDYEYIQAGKRIYFNQSTTENIKVDYNWVTDYVKVQGVLRSNVPISPELTPKVNEIRLLINNSVI